MSKIIEVYCEMLHNLIAASSDALELLDAVHCYDTDVYENLKNSVDKIVAKYGEYE